MVPRNFATVCNKTTHLCMQGSYPDEDTSEGSTEGPQFAEEEG